MRAIVRRVVHALEVVVDIGACAPPLVVEILLTFYDMVPISIGHALPKGWVAILAPTVTIHLIPSPSFEIDRSTQRSTVVYP